MPAAWVSAGVALYGALSGPGSGSSPQQAQQAVDPFAQYRQQYGQQLNALMATPSSVQNDPGFQAQLQQGAGQVTRNAAATGQNVSGAEQNALFQQGMTQQNQYFQQDLSNYMTLSGASAGPGAGGQAYNIAGQQQAGQTAMLGTAAGQLAQRYGPGISSYVSGLFGSNNNGQQISQSDINNQGAAGINAGGTPV